MITSSLTGRSKAIYRLCHPRIFFNTNKSFYTNAKEKTDSTTAVNEAEKIVGYPTSFLSLRWLLNDEIANVAVLLRRLIGTNHPILNTARELILNKQVPAWGLIVLLISKAGGITKQFPQVDYDVTTGILHSQRVLAEVTEMLRTSILLHKSILNFQIDDISVEDLNFGNNLSVLSGDYLLSNSFKELANLKCNEVNELVATTVRDLAEADFIEPQDRQNRPLPAKPLGKQAEEIEVPNQFNCDDILKIPEFLGKAKAEWTLRHLLGGASLLAKCCQSTLTMADHPYEFRKIGYLVGRNMALALQALNDIAVFKTTNSDPFSLISAPLLFHLEYDASCYEKLMEDAQFEKVDYRNLKELVNTGPGMHKTEELLVELKANALRFLDGFAESDARTALVNITKSL